MFICPGSDSGSQGTSGFITCIISTRAFPSITSKPATTPTRASRRPPCSHGGRAGNALPSSSGTSSASSWCGCARSGRSRHGPDGSGGWVKAYTAYRTASWPMGARISEHWHGVGIMCLARKRGQHCPRYATKIYRHLWAELCVRLVGHNRERSPGPVSRGFTTSIVPCFVAAYTALSRPPEHAVKIVFRFALRQPYGILGV